MNKLVDSMVLEDNANGSTLNGAKTHKSSLNACLDLFFNIGASRQQNIIPAFHKAYLENPTTALKIALWARDCRGGAGERQVFIDICTWLTTNGHEDDAKIMLAKIPELGRWDDMLKAFYGTSVWSNVVSLVHHNILQGNGLLAKWMPRKGKIARRLRADFGMTPKQYRKTIVRLSKTVEQQMCANQWNEIKYENVPSVAFSRYMHAFGKHDENGFPQFLESVNSGEKKINTSVVFPHDVLRALKAGQTQAADTQWKLLPNYLEGNKENILPMADVSGSMATPISGSVTALDVCISLALYISERTEGEFKDMFLTFSCTPELQRLSGSLSDRFHALQRAAWGMNTDLQSAFNTVLETAVKHKVPKKDMPTTILIMSDMEFDAATRNWPALAPSMTNFDAIKEKYTLAGYKLPKIVFWKLNSISNGGNVPVIKNEKNVSLISGFSPSILTQVLSSGNVNPVEMMNSVLSSPRYQF